MPFPASPAASRPQPPQVQALVSYLEHEAQPMIVLDPDYNILAANTAYQRQFGAADRPHIGHKCYRVSHHYDLPCDQAGEHCPMKRAFELKGPDRVLHIHHTPRGPEHVDVELRPILDGGGQVVAYVERLTTVKHASARASHDGLVGRSPAFNAALEAVQRVARSQLPVLLLGESGTGKELFARAIHEASDRHAGPLVVVDCSGLPETLFESELFGYEKGAFTGATKSTVGKIETANGGTLMLDEIGDLPMPLQAKLLRFLQERVIERVGGRQEITMDVRVVGATHQDLKARIADGRFREDLYYRLAEIVVEIPPLRERVGDPVLLSHAFARRFATEMRRPVPTLTEDAVRALEGHRWPGNVRELQNILKRAVIMCEDDRITSMDLGLRAAVEPADDSSTLDLRTVRENAERQAVITALARTDGNIVRAAELLGISRPTLYDLMNRLQIKS